jgi:CDP-diacylglycerol pyrophosphatase
MEEEKTEKLQKGDMKKVFIKILEDAKKNGIHLKNETKLNTFLQIRISTSSKSVDNILIDSALYKRYNPIITDLVNRKLWDKQISQTNLIQKQRIGLKKLNGSQKELLTPLYYIAITTQTTDKTVQHLAILCRMLTAKTKGCMQKILQITKQIG